MVELLLFIATQVVAVKSHDNGYYITYPNYGEDFANFPYAPENMIPVSEETYYFLLDDNIHQQKNSDTR